MKKLILVSLLSLLFIPLMANASLDTNLYYGLQKNSDVKQLQEFLIDKGFLSGSSTGNFFSLTLNAVKDYQKSIKVSQSGYVGVLTRTAINNDLTTQLSASNAQSTAETGTTPPVPTPPATTNDVVATLQAQIALLTQQLQAMLAQQTTTQQIAQNTQQIAQNTTPPVCTPNWQCGSWNSCSNSLQARVCNDLNNCGTANNKPATTQSCTVACTANWQCGNWSDCANSQQTRTCSDLNNCNIINNEPSLTQSCTLPAYTSQQFSNLLCGNNSYKPGCVTAGFDEGNHLIPFKTTFDINGGSVYDIKHNGMNDFYKNLKLIVNGNTYTTSLDNGGYLNSVGVYTFPAMDGLTDYRFNKDQSDGGDYDFQLIYSENGRGDSKLTGAIQIVCENGGNGNCNMGINWFGF